MHSHTLVCSCLVVITCRFGRVMKITPVQAEGRSEVLVEFASRRDAEMAITRANQFNGQNVSLAWEEVPPPVMANSGSAEASESHAAEIGKTHTRHYCCIYLTTLQLQRILLRPLKVALRLRACKHRYGRHRKYSIFK